MKLNLDTDEFLADYWQQKPLLIRNALPDFIPPIDANELAGLAMEDFVESRIIETLPETWALHHGPFTEADFDRKLPWTLLVQSVDHHVQEVAEMLKFIDFIPGWRVDDVMVSYAVDGGSVGPHYDNYDVFLVQGEGSRLWRVGQQCGSGTTLLPHSELRILDSFNCSAEYLLNPGDILYLPPGLAHWGIAQGECSTFSLGFRAPRINDMVSRWADEVLEKIDPESFYTDKGLPPASSAGEIREEDKARAQQLVTDALSQHLAEHWFGELVTEPRYFQALDDEEIDTGMALLRDGAARIVLLPSCKLAWQRAGDKIMVFANGSSRDFPESVLPALVSLCKEKHLAGEKLRQASTCDQTVDLFDHLLTLACIAIE